MTISEWIKTGIEEKGLKTQGNLAKLAGISQITLSVGKKRNTFSKETFDKLEAVIGKYSNNPFTGDVKKTEVFDKLLQKCTDTSEIARKRFKETSCPTSPHTCMGCWDLLRDEKDLTLPPTRGECRLLHGWVKQGGVLFFKEEDGTLVPGDAI